MHFSEEGAHGVSPISRTYPLQIDTYLEHVDNKKKKSTYIKILYTSPTLPCEDQI
jgi:hypothetical protein